MNQTIEYIEKKLINFYPPEEIRSFCKIIFEHVYQLPYFQIIAYKKDKEIPETEFHQIREIVSRLQKHEPIQYILGETEFFGLPFVVNPEVLIPRPETEELVELIISQHQGKKIQILDIGTGSGCIAVSLAKNLPESIVYAMDISSEALQTAKINAENNHVEVRMIEADIFSPSAKNLFQHKLDIIVSNPPYIIPSEKEAMLPNVLDYEPHLALFVPEEKPLLFYEQIAEIGREILNDTGMIYFEINAMYGQEIVSMLGNKGYKNIALIKDISGKDRMIKAEL